MAVNPFTNLPPPPPTNQGVDTRQFRDWFYQVFYKTNGNINGLGTLSTQNSDNVSITGGNIANTNLSNIKTPGLTGYLYGHNTGAVTASTTIPYSAITGTPTGLSVTITTAKLTTLGSNGSMTFTNGILTSQTQAT